MTHLTIIGAGNMGRGIAHVAARGGNTVTIIDRNPSDAQTLAAEVQAAFPSATVQAATLGQPLTSG